MHRPVVIAAGLLSIFGFVSAASAADLAAATYTKAPALVDPAYNWSGFYVGVEGGGVWGRSQHYRDDAQTPIANGIPQTGGINTDGGLVGGTFGYNYQFSSNVVIGFETDGAWVSNKGTANFAAPFGPPTNTAQTSQSWLYTARGRLGYAWNRWMVFATGGVAVTDEGAQICNVALGCASQSKTVSGWTAGGGVEYAFAGNWSARLEYLHNDFGSQHFDRAPIGAGGFFYARDVTLTNDLVTFGVNYKFGWSGPVVARY